jgi:ribose transport system ATP-binding protein
MRQLIGDLARASGTVVTAGGEMKEATFHSRALVISRGSAVIEPDHDQIDGHGAAIIGWCG